MTALTPETLFHASQGFSFLLPQVAELGRRVLTRLMQADPELGRLDAAGQVEQRARFVSLLVRIASGLRDPKHARERLELLGETLGQECTMRLPLPCACEVVLESMAEVAGPAWSEAHHRAWQQTFEVLTTAMRRRQPFAFLSV